MKIKLFCGIGATLLALSACTEEKFSYEAPDLSTADLIEGKAYSVTFDQETNLVTLKNLLGNNYVASWITPNGITKGSEVSFSLPFSGDYEVQFGVMTRGGMVYGEPYNFTLPYNNFSLLSDQIWTDLAGGVDENGNGSPVTWVPVNMNYGIGRCSSPVMYMNPDDVMNDGNGNSDLKFGSNNWNPNWDPGFQSWLIDSNDPYLDSEMTMYLDSQRGCVAEIKRVTGSGETNYTTTFNLNISDPDRPTVTFNNGEMLHAAWGDGVCSNYSTEINLIECTPYLLQFATMRDNSEGPWWIVWNFVRKEVKEDPSILPTDGPTLQETSDPKLPKYEDLATDLFTIVGDDATYLSTLTTLVMNDEKPYDIYYWDNAGEGSWQWMNAYGSSWAPTYSGADDFSLMLEKKYEDLDNDGIKESLYYEATIDNPENTRTCRFSVGENTLTFDEPFIFMTAGNYTMRTREVIVLQCNPKDEEIILGVPDGYDSNGNCNRYLAINLKIKGVSGGPEGPTLLDFDNDKLGVYVSNETGRDGQIEAQLYHPWGGVTDFFTDMSKVKFKKNQTLSITFTVSGIDWVEGATPHAYVGCNNFGTSWNAPNRFNESYAVPVNLNGETTISITNILGSSYEFEGSDCIVIVIETTPGTVINGPLTDEGLLDANAVDLKVVQVAVQ